MKGLFLGILLIIIIAVGGFVYRNAVEHPSQPIVCPLDAETCPDGTSVSRAGSSCTFPACPPPNVSFPDVHISFAQPDGFAAVALPDSASIAAYAMLATSSSTADIAIREYGIEGSSTALATIQQTAIESPSGIPAGATAFSSSVFGNHRFTVVSIERFEGVIDTAYYLARRTDVLRFDAIDSGVANWTDANLDASALPAHAALEKLLATMEEQ